MKEVISVRSNPYFSQKENEKVFQLESKLELIIIHSDGKSYEANKDGIKSKYKLSETRLLVTPELLTHLITELQLHQKKMEGFRENSDKINTLIGYINEQPIEETK
jgi:hypothetical protein